MNEQQSFDDKKASEQEPKTVKHIKHESTNVKTKYGRWIPAANLTIEDTVNLRKSLGLPN